LFRKYPTLEARLPWQKLAELPSPVEHAVELGNEIGIPKLYLKRDDRLGEGYGGAKLRKLEPFFGDAKKTGRHTLLTTGTVASNQTLATALHGKRQGFSVSLLLLTEAATEQARWHLLAEHSLGARMELLPGGDENAALERRARSTDRAYVIPAGGTTPRGDAGFVNAGLELAEQVKAGALPKPDVVYIPLGTGGSAAGIALGLSLAGLDTQVIAIRVATERYGTLAKLRAEAVSAREFLHALDPALPRGELEPERIHVDHRFVGSGYARPSSAGARASQIAKRHGIVLDDTYSAKAFAALLADAPSLRARVVLFWLTYDARRLPTDSVDFRQLPPSFHLFFPGRG
jgi:D-cysteine desulfhydrase